ncbi:type VI secretion system tube protein TssD [Pyxidicoccus xibeiensis]|uniref:type VI secretion system tube protein TssD n=1 Tax=Pyxidicoccus xibeiensis TaxID=2906759 RepID=UPI0020A766F6|nr:type VI secretion system tube protein TssD [Pyxidicoccus xibeiensis]MCP3144842.1 type VI secretion system tube protein Hcp [Pyxidicoccus xibeiensis]
MAEAVSLFLKANGTDIKGESTQTSLGRQDSIECLYYDQKVFTARESGSGLATGRRQYEGITLRKRIDKASPLLMKALCENQVIEATFKFFRPNPTGDGTTEQFYSVSIKKARINSIKQVVPDSFVPASTNLPPYEEITLVFHTINWTINAGGVTHEDTWDTQR